MQNKELDCPVKPRHLTGPFALVSPRMISRVLAQGTAEAIVRGWVGHRDADITSQYTHITDTASQAAMQRLSDGNSSNLQQPIEEIKNEKATDGDSAQSQPKNSHGQNSCIKMKAVRPLQRRLGETAEGTGLEPATPYGALHFQ